MKTVLKAIIFIIMAITVIFYGGAYMLPSEAVVERQVQIAAPPQKVYAIASSLRRVPEWSPWPAIDPATRFSFEGPEQGTGQIMRWASNNPMVGSGTMTVTSLTPEESIATKSDYAGFGTSTAVMRIEPYGDGTRVTWTFESKLPGVMDRWAGLGMDQSVGAELGKGLAQLKDLAERQG
ncbi:SRPBCC family protein [Aestuariivirga sp.]|uniref:SRPBCC family protein n=1 Tax=Aestuariivirga sp. TaxID=2650926 RepID=UPI003BAA6227